MDKVDIELLKEIANTEDGMFEGAYSIRKNGQGVEKKMFNPITQEYKTIPASKSMTFKPNSSLKNFLNK